MFNINKNITNIIHPSSKALATLEVFLGTKIVKKSSKRNVEKKILYINDIS